MIPEYIKEILLSKRILRHDPVGNEWIDDYYQELINAFNISNTEIMVCNTLQRRCSCASVRDKKIIVLDNYLTELFMVFNGILESKENSKYIEPLYYRLAYESCLAEEKTQLAAIYKALTERAVQRVGEVQNILVPANNKPQMLYTQQSFLVMHETMHSFFKDHPDVYADLKKATEAVVDKAFYSKKFGHVQMVSESYLEEISCDRLATISALSFAIGKKHYSEAEAACAVILALYYQYFLMLIDGIITDQDFSDSIGEFAVRVTVVRLLVNEYFKITKPELVNLVNEHISNTIDKWELLYQVHLTSFLADHKKALTEYQNIKMSEDETKELQRSMMLEFLN